MRRRNTGKQWERTRVAGLYRHGRSGRYYARLYVHGKEKWQALKTDVFSVAVLRHQEKTRDAGKVRAAGRAVEGGRATMGQLADDYLARVDANEDLRETSKAARRHAVARLRRTWPGFDAIEPKDLKFDHVLEWVTRLKRGDGAAFAPPGARRALAGNSPTSINTSVDALRRVLDIAVDRGIVFGNVARQKPPEGRLKRRLAPKRVILPTLAQFEAMFAEIERGGGIAGQGLELADFCRFLAFSGCRRAEGAAVTWQCWDRGRNTLAIPGTKTEAADRVVPVFPPLAVLLEKVHARRGTQAEFERDGVPVVPSADRIFRTSSAQRAIDRACKVLKIARLTHHDFRHAFATVAIEAGVDIPTVARWLGHKDGGALAMRTYGHLRDEHSQASALKVTWGANGSPANGQQP